MHKLSDVKDIPLGKAKVVSLPDSRQVVLFNLEGNIYALENACPHMGGPIGDGPIDGDTVSCPWHGWQFEIKTGACINYPGDDAKTILIKIENGEVFLEQENVLYE